MERTINTLWCLRRDSSMINLAEKLLLATNKEVKGAVEFVSSTAMTIKPIYTNAGVTLQYSLNGTSWTTISSGATTPSANVIYFRGQTTGTKSLYTSYDSSNAWAFTGATNLECNGKLDRLLQNALGSDVDVLTIGAYCFAYMFSNNTILITPPELPATTLDSQCYYSMFRDCTNLTIPPSLPATTLASGCYQNMFVSCTNLTTPPELPATTLANYCYASMFYGCTKIKLSTAKSGIYDTAYRIPTAGAGTSVPDALDDMFTATGGTFTRTPAINVTYYTENTPV